MLNFKNNTKAYRRIYDVIRTIRITLTRGYRRRPQFRCKEFLKFLKQSGINHSFAPPHHPATNEAAENFVGTLKDKVIKIVKGGETPNTAISKFLMDYRSIDTAQQGKALINLCSNETCGRVLIC